MGQWEEKLGTILNDPQAMSQIMSLARSLGGDQPQSEPGTVPPPEAPAPVDPAPAPGEDAPALDPKVMAAGLRALSAWKDPEDRRAALLQALRPFVKEERQSKVDKAIRIVRMSRAVRAALGGPEEGARADV